MIDIKQQQILFEYDFPNTPTCVILNASSGVWKISISNTVAGATDNHAVTGYYEYQQYVRYFVRSVFVDKVQYSEMTNYTDCATTDNSFYFDSSASICYVRFANAEPPLDKEIFIGYAKGYSKNSLNYYYNGGYYDPRVSKVYPIKKSVDPLFYGLLKYQSGNITLINSDGEFDDWRTRNLYGQACRVIAGDADAAYTDLTTIGTGFIENDNRDFEQLTITMQDPRKALTVPITLNSYTVTDYPLLDPNNDNAPKPLAYGTIRNGRCMCLDEVTPPANPTFHFLDTSIHSAATLTSVYCNGEDMTAHIVASSLPDGTFTLPKAQALSDGSTIEDNLSSVTCDFSVSVTNGIDIILELMQLYDGKSFVDSFFDVAEITAAQAIARDTSLYIDKNMKLSEAIEKICNDLDARFFPHDDGQYTIRIYDANRTPIKTIYKDEWLSTPTFSNNGSEFLTSAIVKFNTDVTNTDKYSQVHNKYSEAAAYSRYKTYKTDTFSTNLITASAAMSKAINIMSFSAEVKDIVNIATHWEHKDIEITDFIICDPVTRVNGTEIKAVYEVIGISKDFEKLEIQLTLRYVSADPTVYYTYATRITSDGFDRITSDGDVRITREA